MRRQTKTNLEGAILVLLALVLVQSSESGWAQAGGQSDALPPGADSVATAPGGDAAAGTSASGTLPIGSPLPELSNTPGGDQDSTSGAATLTGQGAATTLTPPETGESRRFKYAFRLGLNTTYDDNIYLDDHNKAKDQYFAIEPQITLGVGDIVSQVNNYIRLDYSPSFFFYAKHNKTDAVQHQVRLAGQYTFSKLTITGSQQVQILNGTDLSSLSATGSPASQTNLDVSGRTRVDIYSTSLNANYPLTGKISTDFGGQYVRYDYRTLLDSSTLSGNLYLNYEYSPKLVIGAGLTGGWQFASGGPDQWFLQTNLRGTYQLSGKVAVTGSVGVEYRESTDQTGVDVTPVFELDGVYQATDSTTLSISATRRVIASAVLNSQDFESTAVTVGVRQRFFQRFFLALNAGYENDNYVSEQTGVNARREDNYFFVKPLLDYPVRDGISVGIFYLYRANHSTGAGDFNFADNQVGLTATFNF